MALPARGYIYRSHKADFWHAYIPKSAGGRAELWEKRKTTVRFCPKEGGVSAGAATVPAAFSGRLNGESSLLSSKRIGPRSGRLFVIGGRARPLSTRDGVGVTVTPKHLVCTRARSLIYRWALLHLQCIQRRTKRSMIPNVMRTRRPQHLIGHEESC